MEPLVMLCRSIVYPQLSGKAAGTIMMRFLGLYDPDVLTPEALLRTTDDTLRGIGLSRQKIALGSARGQSDLGCALDVAFALVVAEHHITEEDVLAVALLFLSHDTGEENQGFHVRHRLIYACGKLPWTTPGPLMSSGVCLSSQRRDRSGNYRQASRFRW